MKIYKLYVPGDIIEPIPLVIPSGNVETHLLVFEFGELWNGLKKIAVFSRDGESTKYTIENNKRSIPGDILKEPGEFTLGIYGYDVEGETLICRVSTNLLQAKVIQGTYGASPGEVLPPPDAYEQLETDLHNHTNDFNNPHKVTAEQVGAYDKKESDKNLSGKLDKVTEMSPHDRLYGVNGSGEQTMFYAHPSLNSDGFIPMYNSRGTIPTGTPTEETDAVNKKYVDETKGNIGSSNTIHTNGIVSGSQNAVGTKGYRILAYTGIHGGTGTYTLDGDSAEYAKLKAVIDAESGLKVTLMNVMNADSFSTVTGAAFTGGKIVLSVSNIYTNSDKTPYNANTNYVTPGKYFDGYPELGYSIKQRENGNASFAKQACLFICGHGELGTFEWFGDGAAFGEENKAQGLGAFAAGKGNEACGKYSSAIGKNNKAGYADAVFGRNNDASNAQNCFVAGEGNVIDGMGFYHAVFGSYNKVSGGAHKFVAGSCNKDKDSNAVEIGNGGSGVRHNIFEVDKQGRIALNEAYLGGQMFGETMVISPEMSKNYITDMASQVYFRISDVAGLKDISKNADYGPYVAVKKSAIPGIENGWYLLVVDVTNRIDGWNPTIRGYYKDLSNSDTIGGNFIEKKPLAKGRYKLLFPVYLDDKHLTFGFYGEPNIRDIVIHDVQLFKFHKMSNSIQQQYDYSLVSYYTPYSEVSRTSMGNWLNFGFERSDTENYGYAVCWDNADHNWYIVPVEENAGSVSYPGLVYTDNSLIKEIVDEVKTLPEVKKKVSGKLDRYGDDLIWITDSYSLYAVSKGSQVMLETVDPYSPEFAPFRIPQFDEQKKLPVMQDTDGTVGYAISDIEVEKKLGTVDAALDSILAIQNSLMGGNV